MPLHYSRHLVLAALCLAFTFSLKSFAADKPSLSGIYPHLAMFNEENECGTGAVVPWAGELWVVTYAPHGPTGSTDKLYQITPGLEQVIRPESIGGTPANRMIHRESQQLFIGPYAIDAQRRVRAIPFEKMFGRPTGNARHLTDPAGKIYYASMEEGIYEVDVKMLAVKELWADEAQKTGRHSGLPGYHGKGFYFGHGRVVYANNGEHGMEAQKNPYLPSGVLAEWDCVSDQWKVVRRNQFTEVTGPDGIEGSSSPDTDPIWSIGWDHRSLILMMLDQGQWHSFRLPKASHSYDGAHGWNTEWPRIRDIGEKDLLMTMHGMFWRFPRTFSAGNAEGIRPRSAYLKVIGDFCRWQGRLIFGCDDSARSEFLNRRKVKGNIAGPGQSQSNLWFTDSDKPDELGPTFASGAVWLRDSIKAGEVSEPFLLAGWQYRSLHLVNGGKTAVSFTLERDKKGRGKWDAFHDITVPAGETVWFDLSKTSGEWIRLVAKNDCSAATAFFTCGNPERRSTKTDSIFAGLATVKDSGQHMGGLVRAQGENKRTLQFAARHVKGDEVSDVGYYELDETLQLRAVDNPKSHDWMKTNVAIPRNVITLDAASVLITDDRGRRWRLPRSEADFDEPTQAGLLRICREVATERDLFSAHGTFYELPAENADGFAKIRPVASHELQLMDYCSYRGLLILTGVRTNAPGNKHIIRSTDGRAAVWAGAIDDLWSLGKPRGQGGPWKNSAVKAGEASDPYLLWGYDQRRLTLSSSKAVTMRLEVDLTGEGLWVTHKVFSLEPGKTVNYSFPAPFQARWLRCTANENCVATAQLEYR